MKFVDIFKKIFLAVATLAIVFGFFCSKMYQHSSMEMGSHEAKGLVSISMVNTLACCGDDVFEHIKNWKNIFFTDTFKLKITNTIQSIIFLGFLFVLIKLNNSKHKITLKRFLYFKKIHFLGIINFLSVIFSKGILNPKTY